MEDALVLPPRKSVSRLMLSLNPCFNGRCTRTCNEINGKWIQGYVLILVLMEDALVLLPKKMQDRINEIVLILVLMEDALVHDLEDERKELCKVLILVLMEDALVLFAPYALSLKNQTVLILVLMEDALVQLGKKLVRRVTNLVLILVLMEDALVPCGSLIFHYLLS